MSSSPWYIVNTMIRASGCSRGCARIASTPLIAPSCRSISVTSGRCCRNSATASSPDAADADDLHVRLPLDDQRDALADDPVIVDAEHADVARQSSAAHPCAGSGATASRLGVRRPGVLVEREACRRSASARSFMRDQPVVPVAVALPRVRDSKPRPSSATVSDERAFVAERQREVDARWLRVPHRVGDGLLPDAQQLLGRRVV